MNLQQIELEIEATRRELGQTLEALHARLSLARSACRIMEPTSNAVIVGALIAAFGVSAIVADPAIL